MKTILKFVALLLIISGGCAKISTEGGRYTIQGRLLNNCEDQQPVANQLLYFLVDVDSDEESRIAYTDANGYFNYSYEGPPNNRSLIGGSIRIKSGKLILCGLPSHGFMVQRDIDAGTLYANTPREANVSFHIKGVGFTDADTLIISKVSHTDLRIVSNFKIAGPFDDEISITREWIKYASSGVNTMSDYNSTTQPHVRRLNGTFGTAFSWQIINRDGTLSKVHYETKLLDVCENEAILYIDLNQAE